MKIKINTDGGSRGNPGPAAIGIVISDESNTVKLKKRIGNQTNNVAEYTALLESVMYLEENYKTCEVEATFVLDSELVVKQLKGEYKVKDATLQTMYKEIRAKLENFKSYEFMHVRREFNKEADKLVNDALDS